MSVDLKKFNLLFCNFNAKWTTTQEISCQLGLNFELKGERVNVIQELTEVDRDEIRDFMVDLLTRKRDSERKLKSERVVIFDVEDGKLGPVKLVQNGSIYRLFVGPRDIEVETGGKARPRIIARGTNGGIGPRGDQPPFPEDPEGPGVQNRGGFGSQAHSSGG